MTGFFSGTTNAIAEESILFRQADHGIEQAAGEPLNAEVNGGKDAIGHEDEVAPVGGEE